MSRVSILTLALVLAACGDKENTDDSGTPNLDVDGDGVPASRDCDDEDPSSFPGNPELCDEADNDCDGEVDNDASDEAIWYEDKDGDGVGREGTTKSACAQPEGFAPEFGDCDDSDAANYPGADEVCDGGDNDCDGKSDNDAVDEGTWYKDGDADGYGTAATSRTACEQPTGFVDNDDDCNDASASANPKADEVCDDGLDNDCSNDIDCDDSACGGDSVCAPDVAAVSPAWGYYDATTSVTISGEGFDWKTVKSVSVKVGGAAASNISVEDNNTLTCDVPAGAKGLADVVVTTDNGNGTLTGGFAYRGYGIYLADGKGGVAGSLSFYDTDDDALTTLGDIGYAITAMAFDDGGTLYGVQATAYGDASPTAKLLTINPATGAATEVGTLRDTSGNLHQVIPDIVFVEGRLIGWTQETDKLIEINPSTAELTVIGSTITKTSGGGLAYDPSGAKLYAGWDKGFYSVDPSTGTVTRISGNFVGQLYDIVNSMTWHQGELWAIDAEFAGGKSNLTLVDAASGKMTKVVAVPDLTDAVASPSP